MDYKLNLRRINLAMLNKGYSISRLSKECGVGKATISRMLNEAAATRPDTLYKIAQALEVEVIDLLEE